MLAPTHEVAERAGLAAVERRSELVGLPAELLDRLALKGPKCRACSGLLAGGLDCVDGHVGREVEVGGGHRRHLTAIPVRGEAAVQGSTVREVSVVDQEGGAPGEPGCGDDPPPRRVPGDADLGSLSRRPPAVSPVLSGR